MQNEIPKLEHFINPDSPVEIAGYPLRPFTAGSLIMLQMVKNPLVESGVTTDDLFFHIGSFIYIHAGPLDQVRKSVVNLDSFKERVIEFTDQLQVTDLIEAATQIRNIVEKASVGLDYDTEKGDQDPNS